MMALKTSAFRPDTWPMRKDHLRKDHQASEVKDEKEGTLPSVTSPGVEKEDDFLALMKRFSDLKKH